MTSNASSNSKNGLADELEVWLSPPKDPLLRLPGPPIWVESAWHYTNRSGLEGIVSSGSLWATPITNLNDLGELAFGVEDLWSYWEGLVPHIKAKAAGEQVAAWLEGAVERLTSLEIFLVSACLEGNSLAHWREYTDPTDKQGFAIEFEAKSEWRALTPPGKPELFIPDFVPPLYWHLVTYGEEISWPNEPKNDPMFRELVNAVFDAMRYWDEMDEPEQALTSHVLDRCLITSLLSRKSPDFISEQELRMIAVGAPGFSWTRDGKFGKQQTLTVVPVENGYDVQQYSTPAKAPLPIKSVMVGPYNDPEDTLWVEKLLREHGYSVPVSPSRTPVR